MTNKMTFLGILSNVDHSIKKLRLKHGFDIEMNNNSTVQQFINNLKRPSYVIINPNVLDLKNIRTIDNDICFTIKKSFILENIEIDEVYNWIDKYIDHNLDYQLRKIRLYKGSNIHLSHYYLYEESKQKIVFWGMNDFSNDFSILKLTDEDIELFESINSINVPFLNNKKLKLAFDQFEQSFKVADWKLSFPMLMIGMEILLSPSNSELVNRISRNTAVLLGESSDEAEEIFQDMKKLYDYRSGIVHNGKVDFSEKDFLKLRNFLRKAIIELDKIYKNEKMLFGENGKIKLKMLKKYKKDTHQKIQYMLNCSGFGDRPWE